MHVIHTHTHGFDRTFDRIHSNINGPSTTNTFHRHDQKEKKTNMNQKCKYVNQNNALKLKCNEAKPECWDTNKQISK